MLSRIVYGVGALTLLATMLAPATALAAEPVTAREVVAQLAVIEQVTDPPYDRDRFKHWIDADSDGCNTRYEVLLRDSETTVERSTPCKLSGGVWQSRYDSHVADDPTDIEIDHVVALAEAWRSGAWAWTDDERQSFANDLGVDYALVPSSTAANQSKADRDPSSWLPSLDPAAVCTYVTEWTLVKYRWGLSIDAAEAAALQREISGSCGDQVVDLPPIMKAAANAEEPAPAIDDPASTTDDQCITQPQIAPFASGETRLEGANRYATAISASKRFSPGVCAVFIATGQDFPDALSASSAAAKIGAPLLLTQPNVLPGNVRDEIIRLAPQHIYIAGGASVVNSGVAQQLASIAPTTRLAGSDRYATGLQIVSTLFPQSSFAVIATGNSFPDALASAGVAGLQEAPVVLVDGTISTVSSATLNELTRLGVSNVMIAGGTGVVSNGIENQLRNAGLSVQRLGGSNRYETAALINSAWFPAGSASHYFLATGADFPDALAGAALAGQLGTPLYITDRACMPSTIRNSINSLAADGRVVLGSTGAVSATAAAGAACSTPAPPVVTPPQPPPSSSTGPTIPGGYDCPASHPIKGNRNTWIYHVPGGASYSRTKPEECFNTESAAVAAGYRRALR